MADLRHDHGLPHHGYVNLLPLAIIENISTSVVVPGAIAHITSTAAMNWKVSKEYMKLANADGWDGMLKEPPKLFADGFRPFAYVLSKRCMNAYAAHKMVHFAKKNIRVNVVMPGSTNTGMKKEFEDLIGGAENLVKNAGLAGRLAEPREMAEPLVFLNSDMASFITGARLAVEYGDETLKILKLKKDLQKMPVALKIYNTRLVKKILQAYINKG